MQASNDSARRTAETYKDELVSELGIDADATVREGRRTSNSESETYWLVHAGRFDSLDDARSRRDDVRDVLGNGVSVNIKDNCPNGETTTHYVFVEVAD